MEKRVKILLMDDIHIEGRSPTQIQEFQKEIQIKIANIKTTGFIPILVLAGDIGEGVTGIQWAKEFDCDIIYTCGNHEFWNRDFFETNEAIKKELEKSEYKNIHFLNNSSIELYGVRFIGGTLWTNVGFYLNWYEQKNLAVKYFPVMGDFRKITIKGWYTEENKKLLLDFLNKNIVQTTPVIQENIENLIKGEFFNPYFELEQHNMTLNFIKNELNKEYKGKTVVVTHHLPDFNVWAKTKKMNIKVLQGEYLNNDRLLLEGAKGNNKMYRDAMLIGYYANDLKHLMFGENAPDFWLHGHLHAPVHEIVGQTKIISSPVGYNSQSSTLFVKEFVVDKTSKIIGEVLQKNIEEFNWEENIIKNLNDFENCISMFEPLVKGNFLRATEFKVLLEQFKSKHQFNVDNLKKQITSWLSPLIYEKNKQLEDKDLDYFNVILKSGVLNVKFKNINGEEIKFKLPDYLLSDISSNSFLEEINTNDSKSIHYKYWKQEIYKILIQIKNVKKLLLEHAEILKKDE